ncbi:poly-gamma-glutamate synthase PgsB [Streptomyces sp. NP-1717]|uniref:poly-gamma-glutamate synthase PgsB n=1 Tax=unclassified Streptomyces TaxID=2593676 RepID=UPI001F5D6D1A|nr:poly-gamma-glutamate synthase PgsB [Streptomyces sp. NP-1717]MCI3223331.1 poly-gamma-glutamate synthase PgsB [Streptomyces sp. NP-1717]WTA74006.1 poly-gamma-glutamate synthase PgsB [Streptomyces sp. NBC_00838]
MLFLYTVLMVCCAFLLVAGVVEQRRHFTNLNRIPTRVLVNGIRGKSSITRLCAGALRGGDLITVAKTTGTAARFIHPDATEEPVYRKFGIANVVEQIGIVRRAASYNPDALVIECMAVMPALQEINQSKLIRSTIGVLCNVREDHLAEMGPTLDDVARSLSRSMPEDGICVTAEKDRFDILQEEADARNCQLIYADPETVSDEELRGFSWFTFKENVAIALKVAELLGVERETALQGMYDAPPDPGVLSVERYLTPDGKRLRFANVFAANDPESTLMNINQLLDLGAIHRPLNVVINCRPDRVERNGQMGEIVPDLQPDQVFVIGHPAKSAIDAIPAEWRSRAVDLGGDKRDPEEFMRELLSRLGPDTSLVAIGNIHGQGELLLEQLAELPADETPDPETDARTDARTDAVPAASTPAPAPASTALAVPDPAGDPAETAALPVAVPDQAPRRAIEPAAELVARLRAQPPAQTAPIPPPAPYPRHEETLTLHRYSPHIDPFQPYSEAYEQRYQHQQPARPRGPFEPVRMPDSAAAEPAAPTEPDPEQQSRYGRTPRPPQSPGEPR